MQVVEDGKFCKSLYDGKSTQMNTSIWENWGSKFEANFTLTLTFYTFLIDGIYVAEVMVESNETVSSKTVLSALEDLTDLQVTDSSGVSHTITLVNSELVAGTGTYIF